MLLQGNRAMQHVFLRPITLWLLFASAYERSRDRYSTGRHFCRL